MKRIKQLGVSGISLPTPNPPNPPTLRPASVVAVAARAHGGVDLVPGEAVRAGRVAAASAGRQPTEVLGPRRGAVVEALEILHRNRLENRQLQGRPNVASPYFAKVASCSVACSWSTPAMLGMFRYQLPALVSHLPPPAAHSTTSWRVWRSTRKSFKHFAPSN